MESLHYIDAVHEVLEEMVSRRDARSLFEVIARKLKDLFKPDAVAVGLWVDEQWHVVASSGLAPEVVRCISSRNWSEGGIRISACRAKTPIQSENPESGDIPGLEEKVAPACVVAAPMVVSDQVIGTIEMWCDRHHELTPEDLRVLSSFAALAAIASQSLEDFKQLNDGLKNVQAAFEAAKILDKRKGDFLSHLTHELRSPMVIIRGWLELILRGQYGDLSAKQRHGLDVALKNTDKLVSLVDNLKTLSKLGQKTVVLNRQPILIRELIAEILRTIHPLSREREISIHSEIYLEPDTIGDLDYDLMSKLFHELMFNAIKHSPRGKAVTVLAYMATQNSESIPVGLRVWAEQRQTNWRNILVVTIKNKGASLPEKVKERLYYQLIDSEEEQILEPSGLRMVKEYLTMHDGELFIETFPGEGTSIILALPLSGQN